MADQQMLLEQFCVITGDSLEIATQYLEARNWDLQEATETYYADLEDTGDAEDAEALRSAQREVAAAPPPAPKPPPKSLPGSKRTGVVTFDSLSKDRHDDDDEEDHDDDEHHPGRGDLYSGGEKSGLAVRDPHQQDRAQAAQKMIRAIMDQAKAESGPGGTRAAPPAATARFTGVGRILGGDGTPSTTLPDTQTHADVAVRILHLWHDGFSIGDGPLRRYDDPDNETDLRMIQAGEAPTHLLNLRPNEPVDVKLQMHHAKFAPSATSRASFGGLGRRLGSPVPGDHPPPSVFAPLTLSSPTTTAVTTPAVVVDQSQPTTNIRIQLPNGSRESAVFNLTHTLGHLQQYVQDAAGSSSDFSSAGLVIATMFPYKEHTDLSLALGDIPELCKNGNIVMKRH